MGRNMIKLILGSSLALLLMGCTTVVKGTPQRPVSFNDTLRLTEFAFEKTSFEEYAEANGVSKLIKRNEIIDAQIQAYDLQFSRFEEDLYAFGVGAGVGTDWISLVLSGLTSVTGGESTKAALGAANTAIIGAKGSVDKRLLLEKTVPSIIAEMVNQRTAVLLDIRRGLSKRVEDYNLYQALTDIERYRRAGTLVGGLNGIVKSAGEETKKNEAEIQKIIKGVYLSDDASSLLKNYIKDEKSSAVNTSALKSWMTKNGISSSAGTLPMFLNTQAYSELRKKAVQDLNLTNGGG